MYSRDMDDFFNFSDSRSTRKLGELKLTFHLSQDHVVLDLVYGKVPTERLDGRLTGHSLSTWNVKVR